MKTMDMISILLRYKICTDMVGVFMTPSLEIAKEKRMRNKSEIFQLNDLMYAFTFSDRAMHKKISYCMCLLVFADKEKMSTGFACEEYNYGMYRYDEEVYYVSFETVIKETETMNWGRCCLCCLLDTIMCCFCSPF